MKKVQRPLIINENVEVKVGMKLYSLGEKYSVSKWEALNPKRYRRWSGDISSTIEEYEVVHVDTSERSRSFKTKSSKGCEDKFSLNGCSYSLSKMGFQDSPEKLYAAAKKAQKADISKMKKSLANKRDRMVKEVKEFKEAQARINKAIKLLSANTKNIKEILKPCKSC